VTIAGTALVAAVVLLASCQARTPAAFFRSMFGGAGSPTDLICYIDPDGNVAVVDGKGGSPRQLSSGAGTHGDRSVYDAAPAWSPDARHVAFAQITLSSAGDLLDASLIATDAAGVSRQSLLTGTRVQPFYIFWAPDSRNISLLSQVQGEDTLELGIAVAGQAGSYRRVDRGQPYYWAWLKNGKGILAHTNIGLDGKDGERLSMLDLDATAPRSDLPVDKGLFQAPDVSADGRSVAYATNDEEGFKLHVRSLDSAKERILARDSGGAFFSFSPTGSRLAYLAARVAQPVPLGTLNVVDVRGNLGVRTVDQQPVLAFWWSPDGSRLAFLVPVTDGGVDPLFLDQPGSLVMQMMGLDAATGRTWPIARFPVSRGFLGTLPFFDQYQRSSSIWSPDGRRIVFTAESAAGTAALFVVPADGTTKPRMLAAGDFASWSPR
jgi:TolB protein